MLSIVIVVVVVKEEEKNKEKEKEEKKITLCDKKNYYTLYSEEINS